MKINEFLKNRGYIYYPQENRNNIIESFFQKKIESESICECNDKLFINIKEQTLSIHDEIWTRYTIKIIAEKNNLWWDLNAYSLTYEELIKNIDYLEKTLIDLFNTIKVLKHE